MLQTVRFQLFGPAFVRPIGLLEFSTLVIVVGEPYVILLRGTLIPEFQKLARRGLITLTFRITGHGCHFL